jgi:GTP cyclohydrolase IA
MIDRARAAAAIEAFLKALGRTPESEPELAETPGLVANAWADELLIGYAMDPAEILRDSLSSAGPELVGLRDVETTIICPHHLLPASGPLHLVYAPGDRVVGLGALARLVTCFSRRLILQETLVSAIADALVEHLGARGAGCVATLSPACLTARGERCSAARALSLATAGEMREGRSLRDAGLGFLLGSIKTRSGDPCGGSSCAGSHDCDRSG